MQKMEAKLLYSPRDIVTYVNGPFASWMDRFDCEFPRVHHRDENDPTMELLKAKGITHEAEFLDRLRAERGDVLDLSAVSREDRLRETLEGMRAGRAVIFQGGLRHGQFQGFADFLVRVDGKSRLGAFSYEVWDTKLARNPKSDYAIQLCCYSEMILAVQGVLPESFELILGDGRRARFRVEDYFYYYLSVKNEFATFQETFDESRQPFPQKSENTGHWSAIARDLVEKADHVSQVAGITSLQIKRLELVGLTTMSQVAGADALKIPSKMDRSVYLKLVRQAKLQIQSKDRTTPAFEVLPHVAGERRGLAMLPPAHPSDVFFDMEGFPLVDGGLEYLFGAVHLDGERTKFADWWAHNPEQEKVAFEKFIDWSFARWKAHPGSHIYHYGDYEVSAMRRLASRYGTREFEVDEFLRGHVFINLYNVVRHGLRVGEPSYSIKNLEKIYGQKRSSEVKAGSDSIVEYAKWIDQPDGADHTRSAILKAIRDYNEADCESTLALTRWLRGEKERLKIDHVSIESGGKKGLGVERVPTEAEALAEQLLRELPVAASELNEEQRVRKLTADLLGFYRREDKPCWWNFFDKLENHSEEELFEDPECLALMKRSARPPRPIKKSVGIEFEFDPNQETKISLGKSCIFFHDPDLNLEVTEFDPKAGKIEFKFGPTKAEKIGSLPELVTAIPFETMNTSAMANSLLETARAVRDGLPAVNLPKHLKDFLFRLPPDTTARKGGSALMTEAGETALQATELALGMNRSSLCIQGPPGAGKTFTAARMIAGLIAKGKRVAVTSNSHKVINHLMTEAFGSGSSEETAIRGCKIGGEANDRPEGCDFAADGKTYFGGDGGHGLVGGTAWALCLPAAVEKFDYLFIDEAGQFSLAHLVAVARCARNLVLLGDQMQLEQPTQGSHPGESGLSCLQYFIQDKATIPPELGLFLAETWRLHPGVCDFISEAIYEGRLRPHADNHVRVLELDPKTSKRVSKPSGVLFVPVEHDGNTNSSDEEVAEIKRMTTELCGQIYVDKGGVKRPIGMEDILYVAPYNAQRIKLSAAFGPRARVGTVDLFQGQEAPIVILSLCSSSVENSPRGLEFLFSRNRINVAISRAKSLAIVVGHPCLRLTRASSIERMALVNLFCRIHHVGT